MLIFLSLAKEGLEASLHQAQAASLSLQKGKHNLETRV